MHPTLYMLNLASHGTKVWRAKWFMAHYGAWSPKPQYAWSNSSHIGRLNAGKLVGWLKWKRAKDEPQLKTCEVYKNKKGQTCYKGTRNLRKSELLISILFGRCIYKFWIIHIFTRPFKTAPSNMAIYIPSFDPCLPQLREYPVRFGFKIVDLYGDLTSTARGLAPFPAEVPSVFESFEAMPHDAGALEWADLVPVFNYLRQGKHMTIPDEWKSIVPKPLLWPWWYIDRCDHPTQWFWSKYQYKTWLFEQFRTVSWEFNG